ncbi:MAG TPA: hypothetical protein PLV92_13565, partial [Pirellulaceae bacterium]|nr:hypothetical protein [Pirellulaceae bacterium]
MRRSMMRAASWERQSASEDLRGARGETRTTTVGGADRPGPHRLSGPSGVRRLALAVLLSAVSFTLLGAASGGEPTSGTLLTRIGFGSCAKQDKPQPIWDAVVAGKPQLFLMIGDNIYGDTE